VLFFDVVEASALSERLDPEDLRDLLQTLHTACETAVREHGGHIAQRLGDGLLAYFGYPHAMEDGPRRAVQAGLATLRAARTRAEELEQRLGAVVKTRLGIHTGPVVLDDVGTPDRPEILAIGETPNKAARVQAAAKADTIVVSDATFRLTRGYFKFVDLGLEQLRGFSDPVRLHAVAEETDARSRLDAAGAGELTPFVNREEPLRLLRAKWSEAKEGQAPFVTVSGEPGIGKSRLTRVVRDWIEREGALVVTCYCSSYFQSTALWPIADMLNRWLSVDGASPERKLTRLRDELAALGLTSNDVLSRIASLLSLSVPDAPSPAVTTPQKERQATFEALLDWLMRLTMVRPVFWVVEDLHWVDPSTLEFLSLVAQRPPPGPLMTVLTHRPESTVIWAGPRHTALPLGRLDRHYAEEVLSSVAGDQTLPDETVAKLLDRADGVPLYLEEITKAFVESSSRATETASSRAGVVPESLQDSLSARLDRLGSGKIVAQLAATIGRTFDFELLSALAGRPDDELRAELDRLVAADILHRRGSAPNETFIFKHALIQDAAYASLLRRVRQQYHLRIVDALKSHFPSDAGAQPELLAHHYAGAGRAQEAINHWLLAAQRAMARSAFSEAINLLSLALGELGNVAVASERDRMEIDLRSALGLAWISTKGWAAPEVEENYARLQRLCESLGSVPTQVLYGVWGVQLVRGDRDGATRLAAMFRARAQTDDLRARVTSENVLGVFSFYLGDHREAAEHFRAARALMQQAPELFELKPGTPDHGVDARMYADLYLAFCLQNMGALSEARSVWRDIFSLLESTQNPFLIATALGFGMVIAAAENDVPETAALAQRLTGICVAYEFHYWLAMARCAGGWARATETGGAEGTPEIIQGLATFQYLGAFLIHPYWAACLGDAQLLRGDLDGAFATVEGALAVLKDRLCQGHAPRLLFLRGEIQRRRGAIDAAIRDYESAIERAVAGENLLVAIDAVHHLGQLLETTGQAQTVVRRLEELLRAAPDGMTHARFAAARQWLFARN
jgi:class 3 adenylate cyclase/tetratricopeptide (TPR) repeat protein